MKSFPVKIKNFKERVVGFFKKETRSTLPLIYILLVIAGLIIAGFYPFYPGLSYCSKLFGENFCTPMGFFIAMVASLPGYLIAGNILKFFPPLPPLASVIAVVITSYVFYFLLGSLIDNLRDKKKTTDQKIKLLVVVVFLLLAFIALSLA